MRDITILQRRGNFRDLGLGLPKEGAIPGPAVGLEGYESTDERGVEVA